MQDGRNWLKSVTSTRRGGGWSPPVSTSATWAMAYDPTGRRIGLTATGTGVGESLLFLHAGNMEIADLAPATGNILRRYVPGAAIDERVAMIVTNAGAGAGGTANATHHREYYHTDRLGHVIAMAHQDGTQTARYIYTPYGVEEPWNVSGQPFRYTGQRRDGDTGLYYYRARYYDPALGRFIQPDPILFDDQMNLYAYVGNDPVNRTDPTGKRQDCPWCGDDGRVVGAEQRSPQWNAIAQSYDANSNGPPPSIYETTYTVATVSAVVLVGGEANIGNYATVDLTQGRVVESGFVVGGLAGVGADAALGGGVIVAPGRPQDGVTFSANIAAGPVSVSTSGEVGFEISVIPLPTPVTGSAGMEVKSHIPYYKEYPE